MAKAFKFTEVTEYSGRSIDNIIHVTYLKMKNLIVQVVNQKGKGVTTVNIFEQPMRNYVLLRDYTPIRAAWQQGPSAHITQRVQLVSLNDGTVL